MGERRLVVDHLKFSYEGLFNLAELYTVISSFFFEKGWDWYEKINQEEITPEGKQIRIVLEPWKNYGQFYKAIAVIKLHFIGIKDVEVESEGGENLRLSQGEVKITFDGYIMSDREGLWTSRPFYWFLLIIFENYFYRNYVKKMETWLKSDIDDLHHKIKEYLNVFKYSYRS